MIVGLMQQTKNNMYRVHSYFQKTLAKNLRLRGVTVLEFSLDDPDDLKVLTKLRERDDSVVYLGQKYGPFININAQNKVPLAQWLGRPCVGSLADHPFAAFRLSRIIRMPSYVYLVAREPDYRIALSCIRPDYTRFRVTPSFRPVNMISSRLKSHA